MSETCIRVLTSECTSISSVSPLVCPVSVSNRVFPRYTLLQAFSKFGKISKLDFLFHKSGPLKGKPRGYAFVQYSNKDVRPASPSSS